MSVSDVDGVHFPLGNVHIRKRPRLRFLETDEFVRRLVLPSFKIEIVEEVAGPGDIHMSIQKTDREKEKPTDRQVDRPIDKPIDRPIDAKRDTKTCRNGYTETDRK